MSVTDVVQWAYSFLEHPWVLLLIIPLIPFTFWLLRREWVMVKEDLETKKAKKRARRVVFFTRVLMFALLLVALASPFTQEQKMIEGDPFVQLLVDNSTSMAVFEDVSGELARELEKRTNTDVKVVGAGTASNLGDGVLGNIESHGSILLLSDGQVNSGASLGDVALFAAKLNATVNAVRLNPAHNDVSVEVFGPAKALENAETTFAVEINRVGSAGSVPVTVTLDGETIYDQATSDGVIPFTKKLDQGTHRIVARVGGQDFFPNNNVFYKTIRVVPRPKILFLSEKQSPLETLLSQLYVVERASSVPSNLAPHYAVVVNDMPAGAVDQASDALNDFVADGNGLVVVGGENSFEHGEYRNSVFEAMLPVVVGTPEKKEGDVVIAIVIDISGSQGAPFGRFESTADFSKSATIDLMGNVKPETRVAIVAFNTKAYLISEPSPVFSKQGVENTIARLRWGGGTNMAAGLMKALGVLNLYSGSKNIVLLSDGKTQAKPATLEAAKFAYNTGTKVYTVGVGPTTDEEFMMEVAEITNGIYFRATEESRLKILFGPVDEQQAETGQMDLVILNQNHFITAGVEPDAALYGFNQVSPKGAARLLATTSTGEPVLTVWRLGLGRVAALSVDDGSKWAGELLGAGNSKLVSRMMNWAIGDPERKSRSFIDARDTRLDSAAEITVRSETPPRAEGVTFYKIDEETYGGSIVPAQVGFQEAAGAVFAVNYEEEFGRLGVSDELDGIVRSTGGKVFDVGDVDAMVDHARTTARREINARQYFRWPFVALAIVLLLLEIFIRRVLRRS